MASVNRYTNIQPGKYNPRTLQELMVAPAYKREQHTAIEDSLAQTETELAQVDPLAIHSDAARQEQAKLSSELANQAETLQREGFNTTSKSDFTRLNKQYQQAISPTGNLGKIQAAKESMLAEKENYIKNMTAAGYDADTSALNWEEHVEKYAEQFGMDGAVKNIDALYGSKYYNVTEELEKRLKNAGMTGSDLGSLTSNIITNDPNNPGSYVLNAGYEKSFQGNKEQLQSAVDWINNQVNNPNSAIGRSLKDQRKTPADALAEVEGLSGVYKKDLRKGRTTKTITGYTPAKDAGINLPGNVNYEAEEAESIKIKSANMTNVLGNIGKKITPKDNKGEQITNTYLRDKGIKKAAVTGTLENQLDTQELAEYKDIYDRYRSSHSELDGVEYNDPKAIKAMQVYFENNQNILRQNQVITDDFVTDYGDSSVGLKGTNATKIAGTIKANPTTRRYSIDGKTMSYDELPAEIKESFQSEKVKYSGYYSPKNFMTEGYGKLQDKKLFTTPIKFSYIDDAGKVTPILVSRSEAEMQSPAFKADMVFNDIFTNTNTLPTIPYRVPNTKSEITYMPSVMGQEPYYVINEKDNDGNYKKPIKVTESDLQSRLYNKFGVPLNKSKK